MTAARWTELPCLPPPNLPCACRQLEGATGEADPSRAPASAPGASVLGLEADDGAASVGLRQRRRAGAAGSSLSVDTAASPAPLPPAGASGPQLRVAPPPGGVAGPLSGCALESYSQPPRDLYAATASLDLMSFAYALLFYQVRRSALLDSGSGRPVAPQPSRETHCYAQAIASTCFPGRAPLLVAQEIRAHAPSRPLPVPPCPAPPARAAAGGVLRRQPGGHHGCGPQASCPHALPERRSSAAHPAARHPTPVSTASAAPRRALHGARVRRRCCSIPVVAHAVLPALISPGSRWTTWRRLCCCSSAWWPSVPCTHWAGRAPS